MKRIKQLIINISILTILFSIFCYFSGFYLSKEKCIEDSLRSLYSYDTYYVREIKNKNAYTTLMIHPQKTSFSLIGTKQYGFLYHASSSMVNYTIDQDKPMTVAGIFNSDVGMRVAIYRSDPHIELIEVTLYDGSIILLDDWQENFVILENNEDEWLPGTYRAYDDHHQLIDEKYY